MKSKEELDQLKEECKDLTDKLNELSEEELSEVSGGLCSPKVWTEIIEAIKKEKERLDKEKENQNQ